MRLPSLDVPTVIDVPAPLTTLFRCPECGQERQLSPTAGYEIVSVYCLAHTSTLGGSRRPVLMAPPRTEVHAHEESPRRRGAADGGPGYDTTQ